MKDVFVEFETSIIFDEKYESGAYVTTTLYFTAPVELLTLLSEKFENENARAAQISVEYPKDMQVARLATVMISPEDEDGNAYDWCDLDIPNEHIERLFQIANNAMKESRLVDGVTSCCGFDFGIETESANYCPVCGKNLLH